MVLIMRFYRQEAFLHYHGLPITAFTQKADKPSVFVDSHWHDWYETISVALQCELLVAMFTSEAFAIKTDNRKLLKYYACLTILGAR